MAADELHDDIAVRSRALDERGDEGLALLERCQSAGLGKHGGAGIVAFGKNRHRLGEVLRRHHPAEPPAGHRPGLGEAIQHEHRLVLAGELEERRSRITTLRTRCDDRPRRR